MALRPTRSLSLLPLLTRRTLTTTTTRLLQPFPPPRDETYAKQETSRPLNPHLTNTTSTLRPDSGIPSVGVHNAPPHLISAVDSSFNPKDTRDSKITQILTGGTQDGLGTSSPSSGSKKKKGEAAREHNTTAATYHTDKEVLTHLHSTFQIPPLPRTGEDLPTLRSRLQYQSRKRGILETDLLLSTFADENLHKLSREQLDQYDKFLDENDWDIYYWCTQVQPSTSLEYAEGGSREYATETVAGKDIPSPSSPSSSSTTNATFSTLKNTAAANSPPHTDTTSPSSSENTTLVDYVTGDAPHPSAPKMKVEVPPTAFAAGMDTSGAGEWAQTVGRKKEPYRQPPERWVHSEILGLIRRHVEEKKAKKGIKGEEGIGAGAGVGKGSVKSGLGLGQMPPVRNFEGVKGGSVLE